MHDHIANDQHLARPSIRTFQCARCSHRYAGHWIRQCLQWAGTAADHRVHIPVIDEHLAVAGVVTDVINPAQIQTALSEFRTGRLPPVIAFGYNGDAALILDFKVAVAVNVVAGEREYRRHTARHTNADLIAANGVPGDSARPKLA